MDGPLPNGKWPITFDPQKSAFKESSFEVPCGQCIGCRKKKAREWAIRIVHETKDNGQLKDGRYNSCFITLTYDPKHLPSDGSIRVEHFQKFMKRLRRKFGKMRFFHCGEYGEVCRTCGKPRKRSLRQKVYCRCEKFKSSPGRPHYHAILFGFRFPDEIAVKGPRGQQVYYQSEELERIWGKGICTIGEVTMQSANYVARYITKKINGKLQRLHYINVNSETGEYISDRKPEYITMSRRPGIGKVHFEKWKDDYYPSDEIVMEGRKIGRPPRYYDYLFNADYPEIFEKIKERRIKDTRKYSVRRLLEKEHYQELISRKLSRGLESGNVNEYVCN